MNWAVFIDAVRTSILDIRVDKLFAWLFRREWRIILFIRVCMHSEKRALRGPRILLHYRETPFSLRKGTLLSTAHRLARRRLFIASSEVLIAWEHPQPGMWDSALERHPRMRQDRLLPRQQRGAFFRGWWTSRSVRERVFHWRLLDTREVEPCVVLLQLESLRLRDTTLVVRRPFWLRFLNRVHRRLCPFDFTWGWYLQIKDKHKSFIIKSFVKLLMNLENSQSRLITDMQEMAVISDEDVEFEDIVSDGCKRYKVIV